jgi:hypothetical protein
MNLKRQNQENESTIQGQNKELEIRFLAIKEL